MSDQTPAERPLPQDENVVGEYAGKIFNWRQDPFLFVKDMWGIVPQPVKPEYEEQWEEVWRSVGEHFETLKQNVTADWFGDYDEETGEWQWYEFEKGRHITWQQTLIMLAVKKAKDNDITRHISIRAGHGIGKSATVSWIILWFLICHYFSQVPVTAPTAQQMHDVLWKELSIWINKMPEEVSFLYEWSSQYIRMKHDPEAWFARARTSSKENTEAIAGVHADDVLIAVDEACHDDKTEILTEEGWKLFCDLRGDERVYARNPHTGKAVLELPTAYHSYEHDGELYTQEKRGHSFAVTGEHDMYVKTRKGDYRKKKANTFTKNSDYFYPRTMDWDGSAAMGEDRVRLYAWFITEGNFRWYPNKKRGPTGISISQSKRYNPNNHDEIMELCRRLGYTPKTNGKDITVNDVHLARELLCCGSGFASKCIPERIKQLNKHLLNVFVDTAIKGDGYEKGSGDVFYTSSPILADDMQEVILKTGSNSVVHSRIIEGQKKWIKDHWAVSSCDSYVVTRANNSTHGKINKLEKQYYKGTVYCVTVPSGVVMTRRDGYVMWSGNSGVPEQVYTTAEGSLTSGNVFVILIGNPTRVSGYFHDTFNKNSHLWVNYTFGSDESPVVDHEYVERIVSRHSIDSDEYRIRVKGLPPREEAMDDEGFVQLLPVNRIIIRPVEDDFEFVGRVIMGLDPSGEGTDTANFVARDRFKAVNLKTLHTTNPRELAEYTMTFIDRYQLDPRDLVIDAFGVGADVGKEVSIASRGRYDVYTVLVGNTPKYEEQYNGHLFQRLDQEKQEGDEDLFMNLRALSAFRMRQWLIVGGAILDSAVDNSLFKEQIRTLRYKRNQHGNRIQLMPKDRMQKLGFPSPNKADALSLTFLREVHENISQTTEEKAAILAEEENFDPYEPI